MKYPRVHPPAATQMRQRVSAESWQGTSDVLSGHNTETRLAGRCGSHGILIWRRTPKTLDVKGFSELAAWSTAVCILGRLVRNHWSSPARFVTDGQWVGVLRNTTAARCCRSGTVGLACSRSISVRSKSDEGALTGSRTLPIPGHLTAAQCLDPRRSGLDAELLTRLFRSSEICTYGFCLLLRNVRTRKISPQYPSLTDESTVRFQNVQNGGSASISHLFFGNLDFHLSFLQSGATSGQLLL
jgi:hypothetical protein